MQSYVVFSSQLAAAAVLQQLAFLYGDRSSDPHLYRKYIVFAGKGRYLIAIEELVFLI
jgi:hypothetical protein